MSAPSRVHAARRRALERVLVAGLALLWVACFLGSVVALRRGTGFPPFFVQAATDGGPPVVSGFRPTLFGGSAGPLQVGDRLLRAGSTSLVGSGPVQFFVRFVAEARRGGPVEIVYERDGIPGTASVLPAPTRLFWPLVLSAPVFAAVALILWNRAAANASARAFALSLATMAFFLAAYFLGSPMATYATMAVHDVTMMLVGPLSVRAFLLFPDRTELTPAERRWPWLFAVLGPLHSAHVGAPVPPGIGNAAAIAVVLAIQVACVVAATRAYRRADPIGRRRIKWVVLGAYCSAVPLIAAGLLAAIEPAYLNLYFLSLVAITCLPIALLIALVRVNLFDVDRLLSTATSYNLLIAGAVVLGVTVIPRAAQGAAQLLGLDPGIGQLALSGALGLGIYYAHQFLRPRIERVFFAERHALDAGVQALLDRLRQTTDVETLVGEMATTLCRLLRPDSCVVYARADGTFQPLFAEGAAIPPVIAGDGPLMTALAARREPLVLRNGARHPRRGAALEDAAMVTLGAEILVPVLRGDELELVLCLGPKRSGDVYTPTDVRLLATVGQTVSALLEHFAQREVLARMRHMRDALRRYVPAPLAEALGQGRDLEPVEREISVLFVDLRGYTTLCEPLEPAEVFALTNAYTAVVSAVLHRHGGSLIEFSGDGLMAVFGAPDPLPDKECAALRAARELVVALQADGPRGPDGTALSVGIGIATGPAHCGNIRSADRVIWTAIGNIVNLAARLQALTRDLDATIAIDEETHRRAGAAAADFRRVDDVHIRGRRQLEVVYLLSLPLAAVAA